MQSGSTYPLYTSDKSPEDRLRVTWYRACSQIADSLINDIPASYHSRTFSGIIGDIKALPSKKALSLYSRKKGLALQYAYQYLRTGIDDGFGYQACAASALASVIAGKHPEIIQSKVLDVGCAVGVIAGVLELEHVTGFDLFIELMLAARMIDRLTGTPHSYVVADMTHDWPFDTSFDTIICGLVCHHLKTQADTARFFANANKRLRPDGTLIITLPSGSLATAAQCQSLLQGLESFGFSIDKECSGLMVSDDDSHSLFWMFQIVVKKSGELTSNIFIDKGFSFPHYRTPVTREEKAVRARKTVTHTRKIHHTRFRLIPFHGLEHAVGDPDAVLVFERVASMIKRT